MLRRRINLPRVEFAVLAPSQSSGLWQIRETSTDRAGLADISECYVKFQKDRYHIDSGLINVRDVLGTDAVFPADKLAAR